MIDQEDCESRPLVGSSRKLVPSVSDSYQWDVTYSRREGFAASSTPMVSNLRCSMFRPAMLASLFPRKTRATYLLRGTRRLLLQSPPCRAS